MDNIELIAIGVFLIGLFLFLCEIIQYKQFRLIRWGRSWNGEVHDRETNVETRSEYLIRWLIQRDIKCRIATGDTDDKSFQTTLNNIY